MATYAQLQEWVWINKGFTVKTCWIAHMKELCGFKPRRAPTRQGKKRAHPCSDNKKPAIKTRTWKPRRDRYRRGRGRNYFSVFPDFRGKNSGRGDASDQFRGARAAIRP